MAEPAVEVGYFECPIKYIESDLRLHSISRALMVDDERYTIYILPSLRVPWVQRKLSYIP